jgi:phage terminase large subunit-like protein
MSSPERKKIPGPVVQNGTPFTVPHFTAWASGLVLDNGEPWEVEPFQAAFAKDVFAGFTENWLVIPEGNAKTTLVAGMILYHIEFKENAQVVVAASSRDQAQWLYLAAAGFVQRSGIEKRFKCQEGYRRIRCDRMNSRIQVFAADDRTGDGAIFTLAVLEELHRHRDLRLYRTWRGKTEKRGGQVVAISTAGLPGGEFERTRDRMKQIATSTKGKRGFVRAASKTTVLHEYALPEGKSPENMRDVKLANPLKAITPEVLKRKRESPSHISSHWLRFVCGVSAVLESWITGEEWDAGAVDLGTVQEGEEVWVGVRIGQQGGCGIGIAAERGEGLAVRIESLPYDIPGAKFALNRLCSRYDVQAIFIDPRQWGGEQGAEAILGSLPLEGDFQTPVRLMEATATFLTHISSGTLYHDGDPVLRAQVLSGHVKETTTGAYLEPSPDYQALTALVMAVHEASKIAPEPLIVLPGGVG